MKTRSLRHLLAIRSAWIAVVPFVLSAALGWLWLRPQLIANTEERQRQLASAMASRTEDYLIASSKTITGAASVFSDKLVSPRKIGEYMDAVLASSMNLTSITFTDAKGRISFIALPREKTSLREEMTGIDLSLTNAVEQVLASGRPAWSDAYLSPVGGGLAVAFATPAGKGVALGEMSLDQLSIFLRRIDSGGKDLIFILDRRGQVIADREGSYTARQHNLTNLEIVRQSLASGKPVTRTFEFNGERVVGCMFRAPILDWHILVATPLQLAYRSALTTTGIFAAALCMALLIAFCLAILMSQSLATTFEKLVSNARSIESGEEPDAWPKTAVKEFNLLGDAIQSMAHSLRERENSRNEHLNFLQQLMDSIPIPVYYKDSGGLYLGCNAAFEGLIGVRRGEILGKTTLELLPHDQAEKHDRADSELLRNRGMHDYQVTGLYNDGEIHDFIFNKAAFFDADGRTAGIVGAVIDITSHRKAEEERKKLEAQLHQAQKMEAVGQLAGGIAHDFNNILTAIIGYSEIILMRMEEKSQLRHYMEQIATSAERAAVLTSGLLAFSRRQILNTEPVGLCRVVQGLETMLARLLPEDIEFLTIVPEEELVAMADKGQVQQVLMNLVTNARDAMHKGGTLSIELFAMVMDRQFIEEHGFGAPGNYACISVSDTGHGMDESTTKRVFEPFFTTKDVGKGTGLGMAIVYGIIQQHNGYITVTSVPGQGATFLIYLPLVPAGITESRSYQLLEPPERSTETVLLAEDEGAVRELHRIILQEAGYK